MNRPVVSIVSVAVLVGGALYAAAASAQPPPIVGTWKCDALAGNVQIPQQLYSSGLSGWKFKGIGTATNCTQTSGSGGYPVIWASYKFKGYHLGPNTCTAAGGPTYYGYMKVRWYYPFVNSSGNYVMGWVTTVYKNWGNNSPPMSFTALPCPGPLTASLDYSSGYAAGTGVTLNAMQTNPNCTDTATQCASSYPTGFAGYTYGTPGYLEMN
ncbi:hypothetical protein L6Q96_17795 [Candidatus Binatia bacterium]|nr:hypothetical protein [Candidatus Binatia bacterium]